MLKNLGIQSMSTSNKAPQEEEDYNLDEIPTPNQTQQRYDDQRSQNRQPFFKGDRDTKNWKNDSRSDFPQQNREGFFYSNYLGDKEDYRLNQSQMQEVDKAIHDLKYGEKELLEEYQSSESYKLQKELLSLINRKISVQDRDTVRLFLNKLKDLVQNQKLLIDDITYSKIEALLIEKQQLDDKEALQDYVESVIEDGEKVTESIYEQEGLKQNYYPVRGEEDTSKPPPALNQMEYESRIEDLYVENEEAKNLWLNDVDFQDAQKLIKQASNEKYIYRDTLQEIRDQIRNANNEEIKQFSLKYEVQSDTTNFRSNYEEIEEQRQILDGLKFQEPESSSIEDQMRISKLEREKETFENEFRQIAILEQKLEADLTNDNLKNLQFQHRQLKNYLNLNTLLRDQLLQRTKAARQILELIQRHRDNIASKLEQQSKLHSSDSFPEKLYDFITKEKIQKTYTKIKQNILNKRQYDPSSTDVDNFNHELSSLVKMSLLSGYTKDSKSLELLESVIKQMNFNKVQPNQQTHARIFEYAVLSKNNDLANKQLKVILEQRNIEDFVHIDRLLLKQFFAYCLKTDNFDGLGYLLNYVEKMGVSIQSYPLHKFRSAIDFYLNHSFNIKNLLIFTNFYTYYHTEAFNIQLKKLGNKSIDQLTNEEKYNLHKEVFKANHNLVDMRSLFRQLVEEIGEKEAIDPITKEDVLWKLIDFFTKRGAFDLSRMSDNLINTLDEKDIALYFKNHLKGAKAFERITQVILRLNNLNGNNTFQNNILQYLKEYQLAEGSLPFSFDNIKIRTAYKSLKNANKKFNSKVGEKTLEYFLFLFKQQKMWPEVIDVCENFHQLTNTVSLEDSPNEIKSYYLSDALLQIPSEQQYHNIISQAVYKEKEINSPGYITAMTKAYFKDGSLNYGVKFFNEGIEHIREVKEEREEFLVNLFDQVFNEQNPRELSYNQFKHKYLNTLLISKRFIEESFTVAQLRRVIQHKDYDEIENLFQLLIVEKEENQILNQLPQYTAKDIPKLKQTALHNIEGIKDDLYQRLQNIRQRQEALKSIIDEKDANAILNIQSVMENSKVKLFNNLGENLVDEVQRVFNIKSKDEVEEILERTKPLYDAAASMINYDENSEALGEFANVAEESANDEILEAEDSWNLPNVFLEQRYGDLINKTFDVEYKDRLKGEQKFRADVEFIKLNRYIYEEDLMQENDPINIKQQIHNLTIAEMKEELMEAVNNRREKVLNLTLQIFNKIQDQKIKTLNFESLQDSHYNQEDVNANIQKLELLLNDERSPIYSALQNLAQYNGDKDLIDLQEMLKDDPSMLASSFDITKYKRENEQLKLLNDTLQKTYYQMEDIRNRLNRLVHNQEQDFKSNQPQNDSHLKAHNNDYINWHKSKNKILEEQLESRIKGLYEEYKKSFEADKSLERADELPFEDKLHLMRDIFTVEFEGQFTDNLFPSFYAQDLIIFGIENKIGEAVRLGENMMSQNGQVLSRDMQMAVKEFILSNSERYQKAMKNTGPVDNASLYRKTLSRVKSNGDEETPVIFAFDDPYWHDIIDKSKRRTQQWRIPSVFAWDHKKHGIIGEVIDMKQVEKIMEKMEMGPRFI